MATDSSMTDRQVCLIRRDRPAWRMGTGVRVSLRPGFYPITGHDRVDGVLYFQLAGTYRINSGACESYPRVERRFEPPGNNRISSGRI